METLQEMVRKQEWLQEINGNLQQSIRQQTRKKNMLENQN